MKKVLSFVLVLAMVLGSVAMVFAADFTDQASITNTEASKVLAAAGIIEGYTDGSFKPTQTLTRAEGAAIAARMLLGKSDASKLTTVVSPFNDVPASHWAAGVINYCVAQGLINGDGKGNFNPEGTLSVAAFGKMMLTALGYKSENEGFVGEAWERNVGAMMVKAGLTDGVTTTGGNACSREVAAQVALNTIKGELVKYEGTPTTVSTGSVTVTTGQSAAKKDDAQAGDQNLSYKNQNIFAAANPAPVRFINRYQKDLKLGADNPDAFGRPDTNKWTYKNESVYTAKSSKNLIASYTTKQTKKTIYSLLNGIDAIKNTVKLEIYENSQTATYGAEAVTARVLAADKNSSDAFLGWKNGRQIEVYYDSTYNVVPYTEGKVTIVAYDYFLVQATGDYNANKESVSIKTISDATPAIALTLDKKDFDVTGVKEDDYLVITVGGATGVDVKSVAPATKVTGTVSSYTLNSDITVDGTKYTKSGVWTGTGAVGDVQNTAFEDLSGNTELTLILDKNNFVLNTTDEVSSSQYVYVSAANNTSNLGDAKYEAVVYFVDGTKQTVTVDSKSEMDKLAADGNFNTPGEAINVGWYNYSVKKNGNYTFNTLGAKGELATAVAAITSKSVNYSAGAKANATSETIILVHKAGKSSATVYTGYKNIPGVAAPATTTVATVKTSATSNYAKYVFIETDGTVTGANTSDYLVVYKGGTFDYVTSGEDKYYSYGKTFLNGTQGATKFDSAVIGNGANQVSPAAIALYKDLGYTSDGWIDSVTPVAAAGITADNAFAKYTAVAKATITWKGNVLTVGGQTFGTADNAKAYVIDGSTVDEVSFSNVASNLDKATYTVFIKFVDTTTDHIAQTVYVIAE